VLTAIKIDRVCTWLAVAGCLWFAFTAFWGVGAMPYGGHIGAGAACNAMAAEASIRWHTIYPSYAWYVTKDPYPQAAYCHHPLGAYWAARVMLQIFGHRDFVPNLSAALMSTATPPLIYKTAKTAWGPLPGAAAVLGFVSLSITTGFSIFNNLEVITMFGAALALFGYLHYLRTGATRYFACALSGVVVTTSGDWVGYLILAPLLAMGFLRAFVLPSWMTPPIRERRYHKMWACCVAVALVTLLAWIAIFKHADKLTDWISSAEGRSGGAGIPLEKTLESRAVWIDFSFTWIAIAIGKVAAFVALARLFLIRKDEEIFSLSILFASIVQYVTFKQAADIHIFWPQYFGLYYAFALAQLTATVAALTQWIARRVAPSHAIAIGAVAAGLVFLVPTAMIFPDTLRALKIWRETGGRYDDRGTLIRSHVDMLVVERALIRPRLHRGEVVGVHPNSHWGWEHQWAIEGLSDYADEPSAAHPFWVARASGVGGDRMKTLASKYHLRIYGDTVFVERGDTARPVDAYSLHEREPTLLEWMFVNNNEPVRTITNDPDPFETWEWRYHLDQPATLPPSPTTFEEKRIAYNVAIATGASDVAERLRNDIVSQLTRDEVYFDGGHQMLGVRVTSGVQPRLQIFVQAGGPTTSDTTFHVRSAIIRKLRWSLIPASPVERDMAFPPPLSTKLWKKDFIYVFECVLNHRIGVERYTGNWLAPKHKDPLELVTLQ
jgi:hypothetical protein